MGAIISVCIVRRMSSNNTKDLKIKKYWKYSTAQAAFVEKGTVILLCWRLLIRSAHAKAVLMKRLLTWNIFCYILEIHLFIYLYIQNPWYTFKYDIEEHSTGTGPQTTMSTPNMMLSDQSHLLVCSMYPSILYLFMGPSKFLI